MSSREEVSFCRICPAHCGLRMTLDENDRVIRVVGDKESPLSEGYVCFKGLQVEELHHGKARLLHPLKKLPDGTHTEIGLEQALDEIAEKMQKIIDRDGPNAIAGFSGNGAVYNHVTFSLFPQWLKALNSTSYFSTMTIDQPAKMVTPFRLGMWGAGRNLITGAEAVMLVGNNSLVSHSTNHGLVAAPTKAIQKEKARGLKVIVIDPRRTETARYADVFLQPYPGEDPTLLAGLLNIILHNDWHDAPFCSQHLAAGDLQNLRDVVEAFDSDYVSARTGVEEPLLHEAARVFACESKTGPALGATGPLMSPRGNLSDHLIEVINVVCGRFRRAGETYTDINPWVFDFPRYAEVIPPDRSWEQTPGSRIFGASSLAGERMSVTLADEILTPGEGQIRALINASGNPAISMPDKQKFSRALASLELLVTIDPFMTDTAQQSDYVLPTKMMYERHDLPLTFMGFPIYVKPWAQYAKPIMKPPENSEVVDDWYIYWGIARRLGIPLMLNGVALDMENTPSTEGILNAMTRDSIVPLEEIKKYASGKVFDIPTHYIQPARPEATGKFDIIPDDVKRELMEVRQEVVNHGCYESNGQHFTHRLTVRRHRNVMNTVVGQLPSTRKKYPYNPAWMNSADMELYGFSSGTVVSLVSDHGSVHAIVEADETVRQGVVSISHGYACTSDESDAAKVGTSVNSLISSSRDLENITAMVRMSSIPVNIERHSA